MGTESTLKRTTMKIPGRRSNSVQGLCEVKYAQRAIKQKPKPAIADMMKEDFRVEWISSFFMQLLLCFA